MTENSLTELKKRIMAGELSHAYIFTGADRTRRADVIKRFVKAVLCTENNSEACNDCPSCMKIDHGNHTDVIYVERDGLSIKVGQIETLQMQLKNKPYESRIITVINEADLMVPQSQNKLLKTIEEPSPGNIIILETDNPDNLFKTIDSRCVKIKLANNIPDADTGEYEKSFEFLQKLDIKRPYHELFACLEIEERDDALKMLDSMEILLRDSMVSKYNDDLCWGKNTVVSNIEDISNMIEAVKEARNEIRYKLNLKYVMKKMVLQMRSYK